MKWYSRKRAEKLPTMSKDKIIVVDTETTGRSPKNNEILQLTILDGNGIELFNSYIKPLHRKTWKSSQKIHGISPEMVHNAPTFNMVREDVQRIFDKATLIVGYNVNFDINFLESVGIVAGAKTFDVMREFASFRQDIEGTNYRLCKLTECAEFFSYLYYAHDSYEDTKATLHCFDSLIEDKRFTCYEKTRQKDMNESNKKKTSLTFKIPTLKRRSSILPGLICLIVGEAIYFYLNTSFIFDVNTYLYLLQNLLQVCINFEVGFVHLPGIFITIGIILIVIGIIKFFIKFPKRLISNCRRFLNKFK